MEGVFPVEKNGVTYALFVCGRPAVEGPKFFTKQTDEFQVGIIERPAGYQVPAHAHPKREQSIERCTEFLYVEKGKAKVTVFDDEWNRLDERTIGAGDFMVTFRGGHEFSMLEDVRLIEVKQGPYPGDKNAKVFRPKQ